MNPQDEQLNERLAQSMRSTAPGMQGHSSAANAAEDAEVDGLVELARRFQAAPQLRADASFAETLERRFLRHALSTQPNATAGGALGRFWRRHKVVVALPGLCLLILLFGLGLLVLTSQTMNPSHPLRSVKPGEQTPQTTQMPQNPALTPAPDQVTLDLQAARSRLATLLTLTAPAQANDYIQALSQFDEQLNKAAQSIHALSDETQKTQLAGQLALLKKDARQKLRGLLHTLTSTASVATTTELGHLGEPIPQVSSASIVLPAHPKESATISITGSGIQAGAQLLVDGKLLAATGTLQNGSIVFVLIWKSEKHPHSLGIVNPDGTVAQTTNVTITTAKGGSQGGNGNGKGSG